ncbi:hypothetical protein PFISCL1PPCAC_11352, partial [Pristionchus fissidentatus]
LSVYLAVAQLQCPRGASFFDYEKCDPTRRSQCPAGFACRRGTSIGDPTAIVNLCCDSSMMTVTDWFNEAGLTPAIIPQSPLTQIPSLRLGELMPGTASPEIHISDEIITLTFPDFTTAIVNNLVLSTPLGAGGYIHVLTLVDPLTSPWALFAALNIQWPGGQYVDVTAARRDNGLFFAQISNQTLPIRDSYRSQYVVLVYQTQTAIPSLMQNEVAACTDSSCVFTGPSSAQFNTPIAGSFFYLTTARPIFPTGPTLSNAASAASFLTLIAASCLLRNFQ